MNKRLVVFTDLDGTLLDHHDYSYNDSIEGISILKENGIPLVLVSSKTFDEMIKLHQELDLSDPIIFENGAGVGFWKNKRWDILLNGISTDKLYKKVPFIQDYFNVTIKPLHIMENYEVVELTGLSVKDAALAKKRRGSMPFVIEKGADIDIYEANNLLRSENLIMTKGGRFYHLSSLGATKGLALTSLMTKMWNDSQSVAIGDSENDLSMLTVADYAYLVKRYDENYVDTGIKDVFYCKNIGPKGFTEMVKKIVRI